jgi:SpoVK/Ycf46/Vps4 family AAA+-type ATPase
MGIEDFFKDAHSRPNDYLAYHVGRELAELHPGKAIIEGDTWFFELEEFVRADKCSVVTDTAVFSHRRTQWEGVGKPPKYIFQNAWLNILWRGHLLDVVLITWPENCYPRRHHWIVAENLDVAQSFFAEVCEWCSEVRGEILVFQDGDWEKNKELYDSIKSATFDNVILADELKLQLQNDFVQFFRSQEVYEQYGIPWTRGALFIGPPGNGKTHTLKALVNQLGQPCLYVKGFKSEYATEENIGSVFARARLTKPCLLVLEDLDSLIDDENRSFFLNELDGFESNSGLVVLATTNHPDKLDPAIRDRPGRFDRKYYFNLPSAAERLAYVELWNKQLQPELQLSAIAAKEVVQQTENFSFAYLKELFVSSTMQWMTHRAKHLESSEVSLKIHQSELLDSGVGSSDPTRQSELLNSGQVQISVGDFSRDNAQVMSGVSVSGASRSRNAAIDEIVLEQAGRLRKEMTALKELPPSSASADLSSNGSVWTAMGQALARMRSLLT